VVKVRARDVLDRVLGPLVLLTALVTAFLYWDGRHEAQRNAERDREISEAARLAAEEASAQSECQLDYNRKVVRIVTLTRRESIRASDATTDVFSTVGRLIRNPPRTPAQKARQDAEFLAVFDRYDAAASALTKARKRNPFPAVPDCERTARAVVAALPTPGPTASATPTP
jgi:hypothetical protein